MIITSQSFEDGGFIPKKFTCEGGDMNPSLLIQNVPDEAKSLALIVHDPDAPMAGGFTHWVVWNIRPDTTLIKEESVPPESVEGRNSAGNNGYTGPCPPSGAHHYSFRLYALDSMLDLPEDTDAEGLEKEIEKHVIAHAELVGIYEKQSV